jgi:malonate-semialdehyde dehydrogenase (acetylating)/methylmalonate-semialdehyde dehydrogenase
VQQLRIGSGLDGSSEMGPIVTAAARERILGYIDLGVAEGAELVADSRGFVAAGAAEGFFVGATIFDHVTRDMRTYREEIFGPVLACVRRPGI